jgi:succinate dehydrogenase / fumarate reductase, cytochrome b subunit
MKLTSILKKVAMALTGLALFGFLITHLAANLLIIKDAGEFNAYPEKLRAFGPLLWVAEAGLVAFFVIHAYSGIRVAIENRRARAQRYQVNKTAGEATFASRTMVIGGLILLIFLPLHVWMFKFGDWSGPMGLWGLVIDTFQNPLMVLWYEIAMLTLGFHLSHGLSSAMQTLGAQKPTWRPRLKRVGFGVGWLLAIGFAILPIWSYVYR